MYARHGHYSEPADDPDINNSNPDEQQNGLRLRYAYRHQKLREVAEKLRQ